MENAKQHRVINTVKALKSIRESGSRYLLTTTFPGKNRDIVTGQWRKLNLQADPFNLPAPLKLFSEQCTEPGGEDKALGLWALK